MIILIVMRMDIDVMMELANVAIVNANQLMQLYLIVLLLMECVLNVLLMIIVKMVIFVKLQEVLMNVLNA